jgi:hypothetical protein
MIFIALFLYVMSYYNEYKQRDRVFVCVCNICGMRFRFVHVVFVVELTFEIEYMRI